MIHVLRSRATKQQVDEMLLAHESFIKFAVDLYTGLLVGGGEYHSDCEAELLRIGCRQEDSWGGDWIPAKGEVVFESVINIRPSQGNRSATIQSKEIRRAVDNIVRKFLEVK